MLEVPSGCGEAGTAPSLLGGGRSYWSGVPSSCKGNISVLCYMEPWSRTISVAIPTPLGFLSWWKPGGTCCSKSVLQSLKLSRKQSLAYGSSFTGFGFWGGIGVELERCHASLLRLIGHELLGIFCGDYAIGISCCFRCTLRFELPGARSKIGHHVVDNRVSSTESVQLWEHEGLKRSARAQLAMLATVSLEPCSGSYRKLNFKSNARVTASAEALWLVIWSWLAM